MSQKRIILTPESLQLKSIKQNWEILYQPSLNKRLILKTYAISNKIVISGNLNSQTAVISLLIKWCKIQAKIHFPPWLKSLGTHHKLACNNITIKGQKTLWGSCSSKNNINLNYKLIFLPDYLAKHVILHELAHIKHKHHRPKFWELLKQLDPLCEQHNKMLKTAEQLLPDWVYDPCIA